MNKIDFKIDHNTVVHAKTEEEAEKLCEFLDSLGATWTNGESYVKDNGWSDTKNPCYEIHKGMYDTLQFYESEGGYKIITVDEFLKLHEPKIFEEDLNAVINNIDEDEKELIKLLKKHDENLLEKAHSEDDVKKVIAISDAIMHLKEAIEELKSIN